MKKQKFSAFFNAAKRNIFRIGFAGFLLVGIASGTSAQDSSSIPGADIKFVGSLDGKPVFNVSVDNQAKNTYYLTIKDEEGTILYSEKFRDKQFSKNFQFNAERDAVKLTFTLMGDKEIQSQKFKINTSYKTYNDVAVTAL